MHLHLLLFLLSSFLFYQTNCLCTETQLSSALSLAQCQQRALQASHTMSIADIQIRIEREKIRQIQGIQEPKLSVEGQVTRRDKHAGSKMPSDIMNSKQKSQHNQIEADEYPETIKSISGRKAENHSRISLLVPIYDSGLVYNKKQSQSHIVEAFRQDRASIEQQLLQTVAESYYAILEAQKIEAVILQSIQTLKKQRTSTEDLLSAGLVSHHDLLIIDVQIAQREDELIQAQNNKEIAQVSINRLMGLSLDNFLIIQDVSERVELSDSSTTLIQQANASHPELKKIAAKRASLPYDYNALLAERLPKIDAFVDLNTSSDKYLLHRQWLSGGIGIKIPLFDGGIVASQMQQKKNEMSLVDLQFKEAQDDIQLHIKKAELALHASFSKLPVNLKRIKEAEENLKDSLDLFSEGLISSDDLMNDEQRLAQAKALYYQSLYQWYIAKSTLLYAAGILTLEQPNHNKVL